MRPIINLLFNGKSSSRDAYYIQLVSLLDSLKIAMNNTNVKDLRQMDMEIQEISAFIRNRIFLIERPELARQLKAESTAPTESKKKLWSIDLNGKRYEIDYDDIEEEKENG